MRRHTMHEGNHIYVPAYKQHTTYYLLDFLLKRDEGRGEKTVLLLAFHLPSALNELYRWILPVHTYKIAMGRKGEKKKKENRS